MNETSTTPKCRLPLAPSLFLTFALAFFLAYPAFSEVALYRYAVVLVFVLLLLIAVRSRLVLALLALPCLLAFFSAELSPSLVLLLSAIAVIGFGGFTFASVHPLLAVLAPLCACLLALGITGNVTYALSPLLLLLPAITMAVALRLKFSRTASIAAVSTALLAIFSVLLYFLLAPSGLSVSELVSTLRTGITSELTSAWNTAASSGLLAEDVTEQDILPLVNTALRMLPATAIVLVEILAYLACLISITLRTSQFPEEKLPSECRVFRMSSVSAALFLISFALSLLPMGDNDTVGILLVSASNLFVILLPGLALCGAISTFLSFRKRRAFPPILLILLGVWFFSILPTLLAFVGAFNILRSDRLLRKTKKK